MSTKVMTHDILNFKKEWIFCNIIEEITRNPADLDISGISIEVFPQYYCKKVVTYTIQVLFTLAI